MEKIAEPSRGIPVIADVDVLIVGGGPAGSAAAVFAARTGAKTILAEKDAFLGGMASQGLYSNWPRNIGLGMIPYGSVAQEIMERMMKENSAFLPEHKPRQPGGKSARYNDLKYNEEMLKLVLGEMATEAGAEVLYHSPGVAPIMQEKHIQGAIIENKNGRQAILAKAVVDASGDGDIAVRAGGPFKKYAKGWATAPVDKTPFATHHEGALTPFDIRFVLSNIDWERVDNELIRECWQKSHDPKLQVQLQLRNWSSPGYSYVGRPWKEGMVTFALLVRGKDASNAADLNFGEIAFKQAILNFLRSLRNCPGFEKAHLIKMSHQAEVRATRRIIGDYVLTKEDCISGRKFHDTIAVTPPRGDHLGPGSALNHMPPSAVIMHGIPYRCLLPLNVEGLLTAGRCISTEFEAFQGHPSIPGCMLLGQAAGVAAALAARDEIVPRKVDVTTLQNRLIEMGAELEMGIPAGKL